MLLNPTSLVAHLLAVPVMVPVDISITPNETGLPGIAALRTIVGAVMKANKGAPNDLVRKLVDAALAAG